MEKYIDVETVRSIFHDWACCKEDEDAFMSEIDAAAASDVAPVRHGIWTQDEWDEIDGTGIYKCSVCKEEFVLIDGTPEENEYYFCPHCGARMDGQAAQ